MVNISNGKLVTVECVHGGMNANLAGCRESH